MKKKLLLITAVTTTGLVLSSGCGIGSGIWLWVAAGLGGLFLLSGGGFFQ